MLETSTNGAGAADEAAAAGREDQRGVAELGFVAGGRAAPEGVPDPELVEQAKRRSFTARVQAGDPRRRRTRARGRVRSVSCCVVRGCTRRI